MNDHELIEQAVKGDKRAFEKLLGESYDSMFRMAFKYCGNRQDAEDITQDACIKLARNIGAFKFKAAFSSWLYRLVINTAKDFYRSRRETALLDENSGAAVNSDAETITYANEILTKVYELPDNEKTALLLVMSEGLTHREAAQVMECKESTISWYIHEARKKLGVKEETKKERSHG